MELKPSQKKDQNEFHFTGTVEQFKRIPTKTGTPMIAFTVICWKEKIKCVAFKDLATENELSPGDHVEVRGSIQSTEWTDQGGNRRSGWQVIASEITQAGEDMQEAPVAPPVQKPRADPLEQFSYQGGPF